LKNKDESVQTFRDLFKAKYNLSSANDDTVFKTYFQNFLNELGKDEFRKDTKAKKVLGAYKSGNGNMNYSISPRIQENIIEGIIDGGKYGILREYANINDKENKQKLDETNAVLDKFYILLNTPLNSQYGFLLIQSYTEETIQEAFKDFIKPFFSYADLFFNMVIEPFVPEKFVDKFEKEARIRLFSYSTILGIGDETLRNNDVKIGEDTFEVTIQIKPKSKVKADQNTINTLLSKLGVKKFENKPLNDLKKQVYIESGAKNRKAHFDVEKEIKNIKPTIFLEDEGIEIDDKTSMPNFEQIKDFCSTLLDDVKAEFKKKLDINEF
jgi:hypothetical protein